MKMLLAGLAALGLAGAFVAPGAHAEPALYETGPAQDSSFVRFVNATSVKVTVVSASGAASVPLGTQAASRVSRYYPVAAGRKLAATVQVGNATLAALVVAKPGEYVTVVVVAGAPGGHETRLLREAPTDYSAARASVSLSNADARCAKASMSGGPQEARIVEQVAPFGIGRRQVNPVKLSVQLHCDGQPVAARLDLSQLEAGERYSVFLLPGDGGRQAFFVRDTTS